jgi:Mg2+-importing ATPase
MSIGTFWSLPQHDIFRQMETSNEGLTSAQARQRLLAGGKNALKREHRFNALRLLLAQFTSPIVLILVFAAVLSIFLRDATDAVIILVIVVASGLLGFWQERGAANAVAHLLSLVQVKATVLRDGRPQDVPVESVVPGDVVLLDAGDVIPGDCLLLESKDLFVDEATLTGETYPVEKAVAVLPEETALSSRTNVVWMGTHVVSGQARAVAVATGRQTEFGKVSDRLQLRPQETEFERGVRRFGYFLMEVTLFLVLAIFASNVYLNRPVLDSFLFSLALAVGLTPQLLPAIISINLSGGAKRMAREKVIVKRLASIENFGSMNVLCSDKTGTLTEGVVKLRDALDAAGNPSEKVLLYAYLNAVHESGFANPIDQAIRDYRAFDVSHNQKLDEVPYDFIRKRLSILVTHGENNLLITKGALANVLAVCNTAETSNGSVADISTVQAPIQQRFAVLSRDGFRTLGVAYKHMGRQKIVGKDGESNMVFLGFLVLFDPPKPDVETVISELKQTGVALKIITGDNRLVAGTLGGQMGLEAPNILTGTELHEFSDPALRQRVGDTDIFAEVEPNQKERIILSLRKAGYIVGYMGDGINDASALHAADVGISVDSAVDVAKGAADIVLMEKDLEVLVHGVRMGRTTFANTLKYVFMATSANFGNMFSMAGASLFLPFLPLLPKQILLTNLMTDFPEMNIASDTVDKEMVVRPRRWNIKFIRQFMVTFGIVSSIFDYLTFGVLLWILHATTDQFRTGWFVESVVSASLIVLIVRTRRPFFRSKPGKPLLIATLAVAAATLALPFTPLANLFGFCPLPWSFLGYLAVIILMYILVAELAKKLFYRYVRQ